MLECMVAGQAHRSGPLHHRTALCPVFNDVSVVRISPLPLKSPLLGGQSTQTR